MTPHAPLEEIYSAEWFEHHAGLRNGYHAVADAIWSTVDTGFVLRAFDIGCGAAFVMERLEQFGLRVEGFDGSSACLTVAPKHLHAHIQIVDFRTCNLVAMGQADLVICLEVAEHIPAEHADTLVKLLDYVTGRTLVFSAAPPGQGGHDHINERPMSYWLEKFHPLGLSENGERTQSLRGKLKEVVNMPWFGKTTVVLERR